MFEWINSMHSTACYKLMGLIKMACNQNNSFLVDVCDALGLGMTNKNFNQWFLYHVYFYVIFAFSFAFYEPNRHFVWWKRESIRMKAILLLRQFMSVYMIESVGRNSFSCLSFYSSYSYYTVHINVYIIYNICI